MKGGEDGPIRPVQAWSGVGTAEHGDLMPQHEDLDVLGGGCAAHQQEQSDHLLEDPVQQLQSHRDDHARPLEDADHRWSAALPRSGTPQGLGRPSAVHASRSATYVLACWAGEGAWPRASVRRRDRAARGSEPRFPRGFPVHTGWVVDGRHEPEGLPGTPGPARRSRGPGEWLDGRRPGQERQGRRPSRGVPVAGGHCAQVSAWGSKRRVPRFGLSGSAAHWR